MIEHVTTAGVFSLDGEDFDVENNIWLIGDDHEVLVVDAAHDAAPIAAAVGDRSVRAILCTHGHNDGPTPRRVDRTRALTTACAGRV